MSLRVGWIALVLSSWLFTPRAHADALEVRTIEYGSWSAAVAATQGNFGSQGRAIHVFVHDDQGRSVRCGDYSLALDAVAAAAFRIETCFATDGATVQHARVSDGGAVAFATRCRYTREARYETCADRLSRRHDRASVRGHDRRA